MEFTRPQLRGPTFNLTGGQIPAIKDGSRCIIETAAACRADARKAAENLRASSPPATWSIGIHPETLSKIRRLSAWRVLV